MLRAQGRQALGQLAAAHLRHHHVGHQQVDGARVPVADLEGLGAVPRLEHGVAAHLEDLAHHRAHALRRPPRAGWSRRGPGERWPRRRRPAAGPEPRAAAPLRRRDRRRPRAAGRRVNVVPRPGSLSTEMWPPLCFTMPYTVESPSPVPLPCSLVVKNGSKRCARVSASMPTPGVAHLEQHVGPGPRVAPARGRRLVQVHVGGARSVSRPPSGMASRAFTHEVQEHLLDLAGVGLDPAQVGRGHRHEVDRLAEEPLEHRVDAGHDAVEVDEPRAPAPACG